MFVCTFELRRWSVQGHHLNWCWLIVNHPPRNYCFRDSIKLQTFCPRIYLWKCRLQNSGNFVQASICKWPKKAEIISDFAISSEHVDGPETVDAKAPHKLVMTKLMSGIQLPPDSNVSWANVGPTSGRQYRRWVNVGPTYIAVWGPGRHLKC